MSNSINDGGPAFPMPGIIGTDNNFIELPIQGMSLRDWFAGQALAGMQTQWRYIELYLTSCGNGKAKDVREFMAWASYEQADAMLATRNKEVAP